MEIWLLENNLDIVESLQTVINQLNSTASILHLSNVAGLVEKIHKSKKAPQCLLANQMVSINMEPDPLKPMPLEKYHQEGEWHYGGILAARLFRSRWSIAGEIVVYNTVDSISKLKSYGLPNYSCLIFSKVMNSKGQIDMRFVNKICGYVQDLSWLNA